MLSAKQMKCVELMATGEFTQKEIAKQINITEKTICTWKKNSDFMNEFEAVITINLKSISARAYRTQKKLLESKNDMVRYLASKDILDRTGFKHNEKIKIDIPIPVVIKDDIDE